MLERMWSKGNNSLSLVGVQICTVAVENSMVISQTIQNQSTSRLSNTTFWYTHKGGILIPQGHLLNYIHSNTICNCQNLEIT